MALKIHSSKYTNHLMPRASELKINTNSRCYLIIVNELPGELIKLTRSDRNCNESGGSCQVIWSDDHDSHVFLLFHPYVCLFSIA